MPQPRMSSFTDSLDSLDTVVEISDYLGNSSEANWVYSGYLTSYDDALLIQMPNGTTGTVVSSTQYVWYGKIGATMKSSRGGGVVTAFITFSDVEDEIDWEWVGYNLTMVETDMFARGILNYSNSDDYAVSDTFDNWHYYELDWTEEHVEWLVDGVVVRTLLKEDTWNETTEVYDFPQTPSRIEFSLWPAGTSSSSEGTIEWAGGYVDWDAEDLVDYGYLYAYVKNVTVEVYDLPSSVGNVGNDSYYTAFLYNSTDGYQDDIYLTNEKTYLGSTSATGLDPDNDSDDEDDDDDATASTVTEVVLSGSTTYTTTKTTTSSSTSSTSTTSAYTGGFAQNVGGTSSSSAGGVVAGVAGAGSFAAVALAGLFGL